MPSPSQPKAALTAFELDECMRLLSGGGWSAPTSGGPIVLTYATGVDEQWLLGLSAAAHDAPLVLAGLGRRGFNWWSPGGKLPGTARALQLLQRLVPEAPTVFADGGDTLIANRYTQSAVEEAALSAAAATDGVTIPPRSSLVLTGGECNSWPLCYNASYLALPSYQRCLQHHAACYPNSGGYLGRPAALLSFVQALHETLHQMDRRGYVGSLEAERGNDQALLHQLYLRRQSSSSRSTSGGGSSSSSSSSSTTSSSSSTTTTSSSTSFSLRIDGATRVFLSLFPCSGLRRFKRRGRGPFEYCHEKPFDPMPQLRAMANGSGVALHSTAAFEREAQQKQLDFRHRRGPAHGRADLAFDSSVSPAPPQVVLPLLVHANGKHYRLHERPLAPLLQRLLSPGLEERRRIERYPVLLIDSVAMGTCGVATLGSVLRGSKTRTVERAQSG